MKFTTEQVDWLADRICNKVLPVPMLMRFRYGIDPCQKCLDVVEELLDEIRSLEDDAKRETV
jgi:hypothetical protein